MINEKYAVENGYTFTGHYDWNKDTIKERAKEIRKQGNKAVVVYVPASPLSRSSRGGGYSVYWIESEKNKQVRIANERSNRLSYLFQQRVRLEEEFNAAIAKIDEEMKDLREGL